MTEYGNYAFDFRFGKGFLQRGLQKSQRNPHYVQTTPVHDEELQR